MVGASSCSEAELNNGCCPVPVSAASSASRTCLTLTSHYFLQTPFAFLRLSHTHTHTLGPLPLAAICCCFILRLSCLPWGRGTCHWAANWI